MRAVIGFIVGAVLWMPTFFLMTALVAFLWPAYAAHGRTWFETGVFTFEPAMAAINVVCWALAAVLAGWLVVAVARRREAAWALAAVLTLYLGTLHIILYWRNFPWWYNVGVVVFAAPAVLLGAKLASGFVRRAAAAA